jgi:hypothetical protein
MLAGTAFQDPDATKMQRKSNRPGHPAWLLAAPGSLVEFSPSGSVKLVGDLSQCGNGFGPFRLAELQEQLFDVINHQTAKAVSPHPQVPMPPTVRNAFPVPDVSTYLGLALL